MYTPPPWSRMMWLSNCETVAPQLRSPPTANWMLKTRPSRAAKTGTPIATSRKLLIPVSWPLWPS